ncbi:MAG: TetR/AcrR family transcriptional regulator [Pseudomonadota bacterium]
MPATKQKLPKPPPRPYHHGDLRNALIQAGLEILAEGGTQALGFRDVARRAGVSSAAPYRHFPGKAGLLAAIAEEGFHKMLQLEEIAIASFTDDPLQQLRAKCAVYIQFSLDNPQHIRVMFGGILAHPEAPNSLHHAANKLFSLLVNKVQACQSAGVFCPGNAEQQAMTIWSVLHGLTMILLDSNRLPVQEIPRDPIAMTNWILAPLLTGLLV